MLKIKGEDKIHKFLSEDRKDIKMLRRDICSISRNYAPPSKRKMIEEDTCHIIFIKIEKQKITI